MTNPVLRPGILLLAAWATSMLTVKDAFANPAESEAPPPQIAKQNVEFFEKSIRPILVEKCYRCHSAEADDLMGGLLLDSRAGVAAGGDSGEIVTSRDPEQSQLIAAVRWTDDSLQMPPDGKLNDQQIAALEHWVALGAPDPREASATATPIAERSIDLDAGRKWWAFQPIEPLEEPSVEGVHWPKTKIDHFVLSKLQENQLEPSDPADRATLVRRAFLDLTGLRPTFEQVEAFVADDSPDAYERLVERLLASPHYGERWGRYWLDVVRYGEDNFTGEATTPGFPFAWRYRDWVIQALNDDLRYDRFVKLQLAADLISDAERTDMVALGFLGAAPSYHKDGRLSKDVVETLCTDDWDERVDTVSRGLLGLTVACARCHDHKFDPILTSDYYSFAGVFASTVQAPRPLAEIDADAERRFMVDTQRIFYRSYAANLLRDDPGSKPDEAREKVIRFREEMETIKEENAGLRDSHPELYTYLSRLAKQPKPYDDEPTRDELKDQAAERRGRRDRRRRGRRAAPIFHAVYDAAFYVDGSDPDFTTFDIRPEESRDLRVLPGGNVTRPGELARRGFPAVLAKSDRRFHEGSGRRELAERIFDDAAALSARVIVNRVWGWHFGKPLVATPSDFGTQGQPPSHPRLLDDLAARFVENGYSWKWLHREIMLSATYRQSSRPRDEALHVDPANDLLWRMNPRRLDVEAYRDCLLQASGNLDDRMSGPSDDLDRAGNHRRTVYGRVSRGRPTTLLQLYDFPPPTMHSPQRETTTSPLQQLFMMNSEFVADQAEALVRSIREDVESNGGVEPHALVREMYRRIFARDPDRSEIELAEQFLQEGSPAHYAQALLATNEVIFWP